MRSFCKPLIPLNTAKLRIISHAHKYFRLFYAKKQTYGCFFLCGMWICRRNPHILRGKMYRILKDGFSASERRSFRR